MILRKPGSTYRHRLVGDALDGYRGEDVAEAEIRVPSTDDRARLWPLIVEWKEKESKVGEDVRDLECEIAGIALVRLHRVFLETDDGLEELRMERREEGKVPRADWDILDHSARWEIVNAVALSTRLTARDRKNSSSPSPGASANGRATLEDESSAELAELEGGSVETGTAPHPSAESAMAAR